MKESTRTDRDFLIKRKLLSNLIKWLIRNNYTKMLKISRFKIKNFRQFRDVEVEFDEDKGIFLFIGKNGIGKSNFLNAVCWCLYGKQPFKALDTEKSLLNEETAEEDPNARISVELEIIMDDDCYSIRRSKTEIQDSQFVVMKKHGQDWKEVDNPNIIVNNFLPESVMNFFVFDGEAIQNLFKGDYAKNIKASVERVSDIEIIDNALDHMRSVSDDLRKKLSKDTPKEKEKEEELTLAEKDIEKSREELGSKESLVVTLQESLRKLKKEEEFYTKYRDLHNERDELGHQLDNSEKKYKEYQAEINSLICNLAPFYYAKDGLDEVRKLVEKDMEKGEIPSDIKGKFIVDLIDRGKCICGNHIVAGGAEHEALKKLLNVAESKDEREILVKDSYLIESTLNEIKSLPQKLNALRGKKSRERIEIEKLQRRIKDIKEQLKSAPDKEVGNLEKTIQLTENQISDALKDIGSLNKGIQIESKRVSEIQEEMKQAIAKRGQNDKLSKEYVLIDESLKQMTKIREKLIRQVGAVVSMQTDKYFKELIWKKGEFEKIKFDENYTVHVYKTGKDNISTLRDLSTGELKVLGFATLKALAEISGFKVVPVFIDGPLEYLDEEVQTSFLEQLPNFMPEKQVFVFSVDRESILKFGKKHIKPSNFFRFGRAKDSLSTEVSPYNS